MTRTDAGYEATREALAILERSLVSMVRRRAAYGPNFRFDAEQVVEEILKLRAEIDEYTGLAAFLKEFGPPPPPDVLHPLATGGANNGTQAGSTADPARAMP
jgi:hypothetical protein